MNIAAATGDAERAFALMARSVALAEPEERLPTLRDAATGLREHVSAGRLNAVVVSDRIFEVAELHGLAGGHGAEIGEIVRMAIDPPQDDDAADEIIVDESEEAVSVSLPWATTQALESWARILAGVDRAGLAKQFARGATEILRLASPDATPEQWQQLVDDLHRMGESHGLSPAAVQSLMEAATQAPPDQCAGAAPPPPPPLPAASDSGPQSAPFHADYPESVDGVRDFEMPRAPAPAPLATMTPEAWRGTEPKPMRWFAQGRIPAGDVTLYAGNGGSGKTETLVELLISAAADLGDWLGCVVEPGPVLFLSCEEPDDNIRDRVERICKHRCIDPYALSEMHIHYPDLEATSLVSVDRAGVVTKSAMFESVIRFAQERRPVLIAIDSAAAVFDGDAISRRLVRAFLSMLRKLAIETGAAVVLLDHPSVRGMSDGSGTAGSVDWRNSVRSMMFLSDPDKDDPDVRTLELKKTNRGKIVEKVRLRWNGLTFSTETTGGAPSPYRAAADRDVEELFLRLLDKRNAQGRPVRPSTGRGSAPSEMADDPDANGVKASAFRAAMERLFTAGTIKMVETGSPAKRVKHIERAQP